MLGGKNKELFKRVLASVLAGTMTVSLFNASTVTALAAEVETEAAEQTESETEAVEGTVEVDETVEDASSNDEEIESAVGDNLEAPVDAEVEADEETVEDESMLDALADMVSAFSLGEKDYTQFTEDEVVADFKFGTDITADSVYDEEAKRGFDKIEFSEAAKGWSGNVYYPREEKYTKSDASYVKAADGALEISSKVWTETESTGYGVYTYENTSAFSFDTENADYEVEVTFVNPTGAGYNAYVEAEDITKASNIDVAAGASKTVSFTSCLVDGSLTLKFLGTSGATTEAAATEQKVYVSEVKIKRLATNAAREDGKPTIFIASDSTVQSYEQHYYPQTGWGQVLAEFFGDGKYQEVTSATAGYSQSKTYEVSNAVVENRAIGGRSSSSFVTEGKLDDLLEDIRPGDYLLVQWGHNDATYSRPNRYVSSADFEKWMQIYVDAAYQRGATPVLVTPVARYSYTTDAEGKLVSYASNFEAYRQVMIKMSKEQGIALVDLTQRSIDLANTFGIDGGKSLWLYTNAGDYPGGAYAGGSTDSTHLQWYGAFKFAQCVAAGIVEAGNSAVYSNENNSNEDNKAALAKLASLIDLRNATTAPAQVTGLEVGTIGSKSVSMAWNSDANSEMYHIYRAEVASVEEGENYTFAEDAQKYSVSRATKYSDSSCEAGKTYVYAIRGYNSLGLGNFSEKIVVTTKSAGMRFDFNYNNSATQDGWTGINQNQMYDKEVGYGWISAPNNGRSRGNNGTVGADLADMAGDFNLGAGEFAVDLPNGDYEITVYAADLLAGTSTIKPSYSAEGEGIGGISCKQSLGSVSANVRVLDGQLNLVVGGTNMYINGLTITEILKAPTGLVATEASVAGSKYSFLLGFNGIDEAAGYTIYEKGQTDKEFKVAKTFTVEEYAADELSCRAMSVNLGEDYQYYVTAYTSDGTESAPSNIITVNALLDVATPKAPTNVKCVFPTEDTEGVQREIKLSWDAAEVEDSTYPVIKYIVYRSDVAESDSSFKSFEKIGETNDTSFTDASEGIATNVHYYYKVCGSNAGGAGELSETVVTPVTGSLVAGNREVLKDRAVYAINLSESVKGYATNGQEITDGVYVSWRAFEEEFTDNKLTTTFTVFVDDKAVESDIKATNVILTNVPKNAKIKVVGSTDASIHGGLDVVEVKALDKQYVEMQLDKPADQKMPDGATTSFTANDMSVGDVDGDGVLELIVKWYPGNAQDNSKGGYTGTTIIDTYDVNWNTGDAKFLSRVDLGVNIRSGAHYTQFQVWDFDGDGKAEMAVKTADGSTSYVPGILGLGLSEVDHVGECSAKDLPTDVVSAKNDYRNASGYVLSGPEYFTIFNLDDGTILDTVEYTPGRGSVSKWGDAYGNRVDRFLSATAYLDGEHPFAVMGRGYYTRTALTAYGVKAVDPEKDEYKIYTLWAYDTDNGDGPEGQGNHNLVVADVDEDGKDEIVYGSSCYDHDGTLKYSTGFGHGDAMHVSDWIPSHPGLEVMEVHEEWNQKYQVEIHDAKTGEVIIGYPVSNTDVGRGVAADIDPTAIGAEFWASNGPSGEGTGEWDSTDSSVIATEGSSTTNWNVLTFGKSPAANATLYWDGDLLAEIQDHKFNNKNGNYYPEASLIAKWNYLTGSQENLLFSEEILTSNGTKGNFGLIADLTGDWRDEFIARCSADDSKVRLYQTTYVSDYVIPCALDDLQYREGVAWENVAYNQPTHTSYLVSKGLVTARVFEGDVDTDSAELLFTPANDGDTYGHEITGYSIYKDGELVETVNASDLKKKVVAGESKELVAPVKPEAVSYKFDFGAGAVADGYTQVKANAAYSEETGYGFTTTEGLSDKAYKSWNDDANAALFNDSVLGWIANGSAEFKVDLPNGTYDVTYTIANGSGAVYDAVTAEGKAFADVRRGNSDVQATSQTITVEVTDGQLNIVNTVSKSGYAALYFTAITVETNAEAFKAAEAAYDSAKAEYEEELKKQEANSMYSYTVKNLESNKTYSFAVAAVVDGHDTYLSKACDIKTTVAIASVKDFELNSVVAGTKLDEFTSSLPETVSVVGEDGKEYEISVTWDASNVDINTAGEYTVIGSVRGYSQKLEKTLKVVANELKGIAKLEKVMVVAGSDKVDLPTKVEAEFTNGTKEAIAVTWDTTSLDLNTVGEYTLEGTLATELAGLDEKPVVTVVVAADYAVSVETVSIEVEVGNSIIDALPATVPAKMASGKTGEAEVSWKLDGVENIDTNTPGNHMIHGKVDGIEGDVLCDVTVAYKAIYKFDLGVDTKVVADGWTGLTVNGKGGKKTASDLGVQYTEEKGYGFANPDAVIEGRTESVTGTAVYPTNVVTDFALMAGQTFVVDLPNGEYLVQVMTNCGIGSTSATVEVEGVSQNMSANKSFTVKDYNVTVEDGQLTIVDKSSLSRIGAIVVRSKATAVKECEHVADEAVIENKVDATCDKDGSYDSVIYCAGCGNELSRETITIPAGHLNVDTKEEGRVNSTCTVQGYYYLVTRCNDCDTVILSDKVDLPLDSTAHTCKDELTPATVKKDGKIESKCSECGFVEKTTTIKQIGSIVLDEYHFVYDGKEHQPKVSVTDVWGVELVEDVDYTVSFSSKAVNKGSYSATIKFTGNYSGTDVKVFYVESPVVNTVAKVITPVVDKVVSTLRNIFGKIFK